MPLPLMEAVEALEAVVANRDGAAWREAHQALREAMGSLTPDEARAAGPRLAALAPQVPVGVGSILAIYAGACVENGASPADCAAPILTGVRRAVEEAAAFRELCRKAGLGDEELPAPDSDPDDELVERLGGQSAFSAVHGWWSLEQWGTAGLAVLADAAVRRSLPDREAFVACVADLFDARPDLRCLYYALLMLDDEPVVVLHRPTGTGYRVRISGIGDNFQLHTLLAAALVRPDRIPGTPPRASWVAMAQDAPMTPELMSETVAGQFNLVAPDGGWIWNEGTPSDIPLVDGVRVLVLDPPPYQRGWNNVRFFPMIHGSVTLEEVLSPEEAARRLAGVKEPKGFGAAAAKAAPAAPAPKPSWRSRFRRS